MLMCNSCLEMPFLPSRRSDLGYAGRLGAVVKVRPVDGNDPAAPSHIPTFIAFDPGSSTHQLVSSHPRVGLDSSSRKPAQSRLYLPFEGDRR